MIHDTLQASIQQVVDTAQLLKERIPGYTGEDALELLNEVPALIHIRDQVTRGIIWCNGTWERTFQISREEIIQDGEEFLKRIIYEDDVYLSKYSSDHYKQTPKSFGGVIRVKIPGFSEPHWLVGISIPFRYDNRGSITQTLCAFLDITEAIHTESQLNIALQYVLSQSYKEILAKLTRREKEIIQLLIEGYSNQRIAEKLFLSKHTIETHRKNIRNKLDVKTTSEMVALAKKLGL